MQTGRADDEGEATMTPDEVAERLHEWTDRGPGRRVAYVEQDGPRRTWTLFEGPTQVGHVRLRERQPHGRPNALVPEWHMETSRGIAREAIGLHDGDDVADRD
jgi:hypothetical protein